MKTAALSMLMLLGVATAQARESDARQDTEKAALAKNAPLLAAALKQTKVSLARGLKASEAAGKPISAKFEIENGKLQLSVYAAKDGKYYEVIVDQTTGKIAKTEPITGGDDLAAAKRQAQAMAGAKRSLREAVAQAEKANAGFKAVRVTPQMEDGAARASIGLLKGTEAKQADERL